MADRKTTDTPDAFVLSGCRLSPWIKEPAHVGDVLKRFGPLPEPALRNIVEELDTAVMNYRIALKKRALKFDEADPILEQFEKSLLKVKRQWTDDKFRPLHPAFVALSLELIPTNERKQQAERAMAAINLDLVATTLLQITKKLRNPDAYAAAHHRPRSMSFERAFLWEPLLRLMERNHVQPGEHGSFLGAIKALHLAAGIGPPSEGAIKKMRHDQRKRRTEITAARKKRAQAQPFGGSR